MRASADWQRRGPLRAARMRRLIYFINVYMIPDTTLASEPLLLLHDPPRHVSNRIRDGVPILCGKLREVELVGMPAQEGRADGFFSR